MTNPTRKLWNRGTDESEQEAPAAPIPAVSEQAATPDVADQGSAAADAPADLADVGAEVGTVLKSAQEAAARIRSQAREEATKIREESKTAADAELAEARRLADADRAEGAQLRAQAETFAQELRTNAEREADQLLETTRARMAHVDAEVAEKVREAESEALRRRDALQAESKLYEERLEKMLGVFRGMRTRRRPRAQRSSVRSSRTARAEPDRGLPPPVRC